MNIRYFIKLLRFVNPWKTMYVNFHYFPFKTAIKTPVFVCWRTKFKSLGGAIILPTNYWRGMVQFGLPQVGTQDWFYERTILEISGNLIIKGNAYIGRGTKISVAKGATLSFGDNLEITANTQIICQKEIVFGNNNLLSWNILIMDTDFHKLITDDVYINRPSPIFIGTNVWIGCRATILKGVSIGDNNVIAANSTITKSIDNENCVVGGHGKSIEILKRDVHWER